MYELRAKMSKYTPNLVQLLEGSDEFYLPLHLQSKYQTSCNHALYGVCPSSLHVPNVGNEIGIANLELFILSHVIVPPKQLVALMPFCGEYC